MKVGTIKIPKPVFNKKKKQLRFNGYFKNGLII